MTRRPSLGPLLALFLAAGITAIGCPATNRCSAVACPDQETCDPVDGLCKCGGDSGAQGIVCAPNEYCDATRQICILDLCRMKTCYDGNTCDPEDGLCKCGGKICPPNEICDNTSHLCPTGPACMGVICGAGSSCNPNDGKCKCHGVDCGAGNTCLPLDAGGCQPDPCYGVACAAADEGIECILGVCRCGKGNGNVNVNDPVCSRTEHCQNGQCNLILGCDAVAPCYGYDVCNPLDLACHCGSRAGPVCGASSICQSYGGPSDPFFNGDAGAGYDGGQFFACRTVDDCHLVACGGGQICDPDQGFNCVCETQAGLNGPPCEQAQFCVALDTSKPPTCAPSCNVYAQQDCQGAAVDPDAGPLNCYAELGAGAAVCETPNPLSVGGEGNSCAVNADCAPGLGCWTHTPIVDNDAGLIVSTCAIYCDAPSPSIQNTPFACPSPEFCTPVAQVQGLGQLIQIGFCQ